MWPIIKERVNTGTNLDNNNCMVYKLWFEKIYESALLMSSGYNEQNDFVHIC
jgi:hypothetical protein